MANETYSNLRENLARIWDQVEDTREEVIVRRRGHEDLALLPARELRSLEETAHLLRSPANALRLLGALQRSRRDGEVVEFSSTDELARQIGLSEG